MPGIALIVGTRPLPWAGKARAPLPSSPAEKAPAAQTPESGDGNVGNARGGAARWGKKPKKAASLAAEGNWLWL